MLISAYSTRHEYRPHNFTGVEARSSRGPSGPDPELTDHLAALADYVRDSTAEAWTLRAHALLRHVTDTQRWYRFELDETEPLQLTRLTDWAADANAILLVDGALLDGLGRPLLAGTHGAATGEVPITPEAADRAAEIRGWLASERQVSVPAELAPVRSSSEVLVRHAEQVGLRILALVLTADVARSVEAGAPVDPGALAGVFPRAFAALSPAERELLDNQDARLARRLIPRIEAAQELLWAISRIRFGWPTSPCSIERVERIVLTGGEQEFLQDLEVRTEPELLNEYECLMSLVWALDAARRGQHPVIPETHPVVAAERLAALSWLLNPGLAWDEAGGHDRNFWRTPPEEAPAPAPVSAPAATATASRWGLPRRRAR
ncbi:MAG: DUF4272 domain-containing protein [Brooklawnia sp.]|uniref:DUF4272 domain-containing protein n=1 Tax=Brooklawnia sp. TaxID=2699740 RepID=UPI003C72F22D